MTVTMAMVAPTRCLVGFDEEEVPDRSAHGRRAVVSVGSKRE